MLIFFGTRATRIDAINLNGCACPNCNSENTMTATKYGRYFHIFFIPIFPTSQRTIVECKHCYKSFDGDAFAKVNPNDPDKKIELIETNRPLWHSCGCSLIFLFFVLGLVSTCTSYVFGLDENDKKEDNPYKVSYNSDYEKMTKAPDCKKDSVSCAIKTYFDMVMTDELDKEDFEYFSKVNGSKVLILVKIDDMKKIKASTRRQLIGEIKNGAKLLKNMDDKKYYIGVEGRWNLVLAYSPDESDLDGRFANEKILYDFYLEEKEEKQQKEEKTKL